MILEDGVENDDDVVVDDGNYDSIGDCFDDEIVNNYKNVLSLGSNVVVFGEEIFDCDIFLWKFLVEFS